MAGWGFNTQRMNYRDFDYGNEILIMGLAGSHKPAVDLLRNCDLPPPLKVFSGSDNKIVHPANRFFGYDDDEHDGFRAARRGGYGSGEDDKLELLKALRLSQTRAREAERRAASLARERDVLADALIRDSMRLMAHRHWVRLLEAQVKRLKLQWTCSGCEQSDKPKGRSKKEDDGNDSVGITWIVALALCLGIAGVGIAFTYR